MNSEELPTPDGPAAQGAPLSCLEAQRQIECLVEEGGLKPSERALLSAHLGACPACRADLEQRRRLDARLRAVFSRLDTSPRFRERLLAALPPQAVSRAEPPAPKTPAAPPPGRPAGGAHESVFVPQACGEQGRTAGSAPRVSAARAWRLPVTVAAGVALALLGFWWHFRGSVKGGDRLPTIAASEGAGVLVRGDRELPLESGTALRPGDVLTAGPGSANAVCRFALESLARPVAEVQLATGAKLQVRSRDHYFLEQGEAYFLVRPDRPREGEEWFDVETALGHVLVLGTAFGVIVPAGHAETVTVVVDQGRVAVRPLSGPEQQLGEGQECELLKAGGATPPRGIAAGRLPRFRPVVVAAGTKATTPPAKAATPETRAPRARVAWDAAIADLDFRGCALPEALERLAEHLDGAEELHALARAAEALGATRPSSLVLKQPLSLAATVRWLARESGLRFDPSGLLRLAEPNEELGPPENGSPPPEWQEGLRRPLGGPEPGAEPDRDWSDWAARAGVTLLVEDGAGGLRLASAPATLGGVLAILGGRGDDWAYYDGLLYVAPAAHIAALTRVPRVRAVGEWLGDPLAPEWAQSLNALAANLGAFPEGTPVLVPLVRPALADVALRPDTRSLHFTSGIAGARALEAALCQLADGAPEVPSPAGLLDGYPVSGVIRELANLTQEAASRHVPVKLAEGNRDFPAQAFVARTLPLGQALEWAARLQGLGLRAGYEGLEVDRPQACYGPPVLQTVSLRELARLRPELARELPRALATQARNAFPELLRGVEWLPVAQGLAFQGDRRQLAAVQRVLRELASALARPPAGAAGDLKAWRPLWRVALEASLGEPFEGDGSGQLPAGNFAGLLRQSGLFLQVRATILVDPEAMKLRAGQTVPALAVRGLTVGQALEALAQAAGLRMVVEDGVIWLKE